MNQSKAYGGVVDCALRKRKETENNMFIKETVKGMRDILPAEMEVREYLLARLKAVYTSFGYTPIETPCMERIENLTNKQGGENEKLIFKVLKRGEKLAEAAETADPDDLCDAGMRYDLTVPLSRYYANNAGSLPAPFKALQVGSVWRADRPQKGRFRQFTVTEPTGRYNSSWMYGICEDNRGRLWISTYEGGVFVVDKKRLLATPGRSYCADMHFSTDNRGFPSNITSKITISNDRCFVATDEGTVSIDTGTGEIRPVALPKGVRAQALDSYGDKVFIGTNTGLYVWHEDSIREIPGPRLPIWVVTAGEERVWTISDAIMSAYDTRMRGGGNCQSQNRL